MYSKIQNKILEGFTLEPSAEKHRNNILIAGLIKGTGTDEYIYIAITEGYDELRNKHTFLYYDINFHINRLPYQLQHNALQWVNHHKLFDVLINNPLMNLNHDSYQNSSKNYKFTCDIAEKLNESQKKAVHNIIHSRNRPIPFLLFGPPGTGKTRTIVAAIKEILLTTNNSVLVCAHSNAACDEITKRLLDVLSGDMVYRMYAKSFNTRTISHDIRKICNLRHGEIKFPSLDFLYQFRVVVSTLLTAGCITRAREQDANFDSSHFSHVFIDEAACTHETASLIPIAGQYYFSSYFFLFHFYRCFQLFPVIP